MYWLNPVTYVISGLITNELEGLDIRCEASEFVTFQPPNQQTCAQWAGEFLSRSTGYLANPDASVDCSYCTYCEHSSRERERRECEGAREKISKRVNKKPVLRLVTLA